MQLECEIRELDRQIKEARRTTTAALTLEEKLAGQKQVKALESQRSAKRRALFDAQDDIDRRREQLIAQIDGKLQQRVSQQKVFCSDGSWNELGGYEKTSVGEKI